MVSLHSHSEMQLKNATATMITEAFDGFVTLKQAVMARQFIVSHKNVQNQKVRRSLSHGTHAQSMIKHTHTQRKVFTWNLKFCSSALLDHPSQNPQLKVFSSSLHPMV